NGAPLEGEGFYPAYIACNLFNREEHRYSDINDGRFPFITQDWWENKEGTGYIANMMDGSQAGFKYFDCKGVKKITVHTRGYCNGEFLVKTAWDGPVLGRIKVEFTNVWKPFSAEVKISDGVNAIYLEYSGGGRAALGGFTLET
ncbi:MAG TPA: alpha-N-arabinofuranosidase, partial [Treponemataceae bacterium]|nr:alpha-N-arabinofuranosidase [Treponemataceae bacterium]